MLRSAAVRYLLWEMYVYIVPYDYEMCPYFSFLSLLFE